MSVAALQGFVSGRVQGVGFRRHARDRALQLGLGGWVRNCPDGRVEYRIEGEEPALQAMRIWLQRGPAAARVEHLSEQPCAVLGLVDFLIREDAPAG